MGEAPSPGGLFLGSGPALTADCLGQWVGQPTSRQELIT